MVVRSASESSGFSPAERPRVAVASDGTLAAVQEPDRITIVEIPGSAAFAEIGIDPDAGATEAAWVGAPPRLLVLSRYANHSTVHLLDPYGPRTIAEIRLESPMRLFATVGASALAAGALGAAVLTASDTHLAPHQFPARTVPIAAGAAGNQFVVALAGAIEEWDPQSRMPKRRLRLPRPAAITALGGSERVVWLTTQQDPARIDVIPLVNRGQPKQHELPEPIAYATGHPRSDLVACVGADTGRLYVVDLDGRSRLRVIGPEGIDRVEAAGLVVGRMVGVLAAQARRPVALVTLDGRDIDTESAGAAPNLPRAATPPFTGDLRRPSVAGEGAVHDEPRDDTNPELHPEESVREVPTSVTLGSPPVPAPPPSAPPPPPVTASPGVAAARSAPGGSAEGIEQPRAMTEPAAGLRTLTEHLRPPAEDRFAAWRMRPRSIAPLDPVTDGRPTWRDELVAWTRAVESGAIDRNPPAVALIDTLIARFDLAGSLAPVLALLYGAHLAGRPGAAPFDVARVLDRRWDEALGRGELAARGVARYVESRVALAPPILRMLDERPIATGELAGVGGSHTQGALLGPCCVIAPIDAALPALAGRCIASLGGAVLIGDPSADVDELFVEARARAAVPLLRIDEHVMHVPDEPAIYVIADPAHAERLGIPQLA